jgi:hypothetical protein
MKAEYNSEEEADNAEARCRHDAGSLAYLHAYRQSLASTERVAVILSHSTHLRSVWQQFQTKFGHMSPCVDPERLLFALSLSPRSGFSLASVEAALFGPAFQHQVRMNESLARKVAGQLAARSDPGMHTPTLREQVDRGLTGSRG